MTALTIVHFASRSAILHSMSGSATSRELRKQQTATRIHDCALRLTDDRGLDGWTMEDLADAAEVSRRTLFNYFASKVDATIGSVPPLPHAAVEAFTSGGPTGRLLDDMVVLAHTVLEEKNVDRDTVRLRRAVISGSPRLLPILHERIEVLLAETLDVVLAREGTAFGASRARLAIRLTISLVDSATLAMLEGDERPITDLLDEALRDARGLLA